MQIKEYKLDTEYPGQMYAHDRIYLGVMTVYNHPKYSVYTLGNDRSDFFGYNVLPNINVAHFDNKQDAEVYQDYIENILQHQPWWLGYETVESLRKWNTKKTQDFYKSILALQMGIKTLEKQK